jgi:hypothetical protein
MASAGVSGAGASKPDADLARLSREYHECVLSQWKYCAVGVGLGLGVSMFKKSHVYWAIGGISGTLMDYANALEVCRDKAHALRLHQDAAGSVVVDLRKDGLAKAVRDDVAVAKSELDEFMHAQDHRR